MVFRMSQTINRPVPVVFQTVIHVEDFPKWSPQNKRAERLDDGPIGEGTRFLTHVQGFGMVPQVLREFQVNRRVRVVPEFRMLSGGHRFIFTDLGGKTRVDHEMEMVPKGLFKLMTPMMGAIGRRNVQKVAKALQAYLEQPEPSARSARG